MQTRALDNLPAGRLTGTPLLTGMPLLTGTPLYVLTDQASATAAESFA